jgi:hypothetical protein
MLPFRFLERALLREQFSSSNSSGHIPMPDPDRQKAFEGEFRRLIERHRPALLRELGVLMATPPPPNVRILSFVVFSRWNTFPVRVLAVDDTSTEEVYFDPPFSAALLQDAGELISRGAIDQDAYEDDGVQTFETGARVLAEWFGKCWHEAGGGEFPLPAYIGHHDRAAQFDLKAEKWITQSEI